MILVTGAAGILGQAVVRTLVARGLAVAAADFADPIPPMGQRASFGGVDLADEGAARRLFAALATGQPPLTGLVNVAGGFTWETVADGSWASW